MAISTPGDIVLDVVRAADPAAADAARARLASHASGRVAETFSVAGGTRATPAGALAGRSGTPEAFVKFEAMVMQTFIQSMLPSDTESVYGEGMAGEMWQSLLAEQLGTAVAARGGIGIADRLLKEHYRVGEETAPLTGVERSLESPERAAERRLSAALVQEVQRSMMRALNEDNLQTTASESR